MGQWAKMQRRAGGLGLNGIWRLFFKVIAASIGMGFIFSWTNVWLENWLGIYSLIARVIGVFVRME